MKVSPLLYIGQFNPMSIPNNSCSTFNSFTFRTKQQNILYPFSFAEKDAIHRRASGTVEHSSTPLDGSNVSTKDRQDNTPSCIEAPEQEVQCNYFPDQETLTEMNDDNNDSLELNDEEDPSPPNSASGIVGLSPTPLYNVSLFHQTEDSWIFSLIYGYKWW